MALAAGARFGGYEIQSPLGAGGMGEVYRARDVRLQRDVAIKVLPDAFALDRHRVERFEREARLLAAVNCPNIAAIYGVEEVDGVIGLVLELVGGDTLADRLSYGTAGFSRTTTESSAEGPPKGGRPVRAGLPLDETLTIARQIVDALDAAHERGIVHRDLKPSNIKITPDGVVKVLDFGLAKDAEPAAAVDLSRSPTMTAVGTEAGVILGTAAYMSPEQARGLPVDKRADIWAFGCVLFEMLTGHRAFEGATVSDVMAAILRAEPDWTALPATTPAGIRRLLSRLLHKDLKRRLRDIGDVRFEIDDALAGGGDGGRAGEAVNLHPRRLPEQAAGDHGVRRWRWIAVASLAATIALLAFVAAGLRRPAPAADSSLDNIVVSQLTSYDGTEASGALSPDGRSFAFVSNHGGTTDLWVRQVAGGEPVRLTDDAAIEGDLVYSPNGETIYFTRIDGADRAILRIGALGGQPRKVLNNAQIPSPSPDGRRIAWFAVGAGAPFAGALTIGEDNGSNPRVLVDNVRTQAGLPRAAWSRDGRRLAYSSGGLFESRNLFIVDVEGGGRRQVTNFAHSGTGIQSQAWLDDRHMVVSYISRDHFFVNDIALLDADTGALTRITMNLADSFSHPSVSADGTRVVLTATRTLREVWKVPFGPDPEANGRAATRLIESSQDPMWTYVTRDGRTLLFNNALAGSRNLWTMPLDGGAKARQITAVPGEAVMHSSLSPDGNAVAFVSNPAGNSDVWVQNVDGSDLRRLTDDPAADSWPVWSPDGNSIIYCSLRDGQWETRRVAAAGGGSEKVVDGFFRGDWIAKPGGTGTWVITSMAGSGLRLIDMDSNAVAWQDRRPGNGMPMFSPNGRMVSIPYQDRRDRDAIWVYDVETGKGRVAVQFPQPFQIFFRASWVDDGRSFVVNRSQAISRIVMLDGFGTPASASAR